MVLIVALSECICGTMSAGLMPVGPAYDRQYAALLGSDSKAHQSFFVAFLNELRGFGQQESGAVFRSS